MGIHVSIGDAEKRLAELVAAALRGEEVILDAEGSAAVRLVAITPGPMTDAERRSVAERRRVALTEVRKAFDGADLSLAALKADRVDSDERFERKFGSPA